MTLPASTENRTLGYLPRATMSSPHTLPSERAWPSPRTYPVKSDGRGSVVLSTLAGDGLLRIGPNALVTLVGIATAEKLGREHKQPGHEAVRFLDDGSTEVDAPELSRWLGRRQDRPSYERTWRTLNQLYELSIDYDSGEPSLQEQWRYRSQRKVERRRLLSAVGYLEGDRRQGYRFRWSVSDWLRREIDEGRLRTVPLDLLRELRRDLSRTMVVWLLAQKGVDSSKDGGWTQQVSLSRLWELFPTEPDRPAPVFYQRRVNAALDELASARVLRGHDWRDPRRPRRSRRKLSRWDSVAVIRFDPASTHVQPQQKAA